MMVGMRMRGLALALVICGAPLCALAKAKALKRHWGAERNGIRVSLALDKLTYKVGEDISLHILAQVLSPSHAVYAVPDIPYVAFGGAYAAEAFHMTVLNADGVPVGNGTESNLWLSPITVGGPTFCPVPLSDGATVPIQASSKYLGLLPKQPGIYRLIVSWSPYPEHNPPCRMGMKKMNPNELRPLTTVSSTPISIRISGKAVATPGVPDVPPYTGWKSEFRIVNTPLGIATALEDRRTHLQWLRLILIQGISDEQLQSGMGKNRWLEGWRFANRDELHTLFADFTGKPSGRSSDPATERALQQLLGGPLETPRNRETGWSRRATYAFLAETQPTNPICPHCKAGFIFHFAYIAEDTVGGHITATIDPDQFGRNTSTSSLPPAGFGGAVLLVRTTRHRWTR